MARMARVVVPDFPHHVTQRGSRRQTTFFCDDDYAAYLSLMAAFCRKTGTQVWAYCLMPNHVHLVMVPSNVDGLRAAVGEAHRRYSQRVNAREGWQGHLWQQRFFSCPLDEAHLLATSRYVECNPVAAGLCAHAEDWPWSSARAHLVGIPDGLTEVEPLLAMIDDWSSYLQSPADEDVSESIRLHSRTGRPLGNAAFTRQVEVLTGRCVEAKRPGPPKSTALR